MLRGIIAEVPKNPRANGRRRSAAVLLTPDGRNIVVRGRLWRAANPVLDPDERVRLQRELMAARRAVATALRAEDEAGVMQARRAVEDAKVALGERGPVWWQDGAPDFNRKLVRTTPYADWFASVRPHD
jgi:hypothetical protein